MKRTFLLMFCLLGIASSAIAQESIGKIFSEYSSTQIIRPYDLKKWVVYSKTVSGRDFILVRDGIDTVNVLRLPEEFISVSDFEIDTDVVYFCGMMDGEVPYLAYFNMGPFPNSTIHYICIPNVKKLNTLEVMSDHTGIQVIMTGVMGQTEIVVDALDSASGWAVNLIAPYIPNSAISYSCDNVAILDSFVVVTSRYIMFGDDDSPSPTPFSLLWYFTRPVMDTVPLSSSNLRYLPVPFLYTSKFSIQECEKNAFVTSGISLGVPYISGYNGYYHVGTVVLNRNTTTIKGVSYSPDSKSTEVIIDPTGAATSGSEVYTLLPGMATTPSTAFGHFFDGHILNSICYQKNNPLHYICVGDRIGNNYDMFLYRYYYNYPIECSERINVRTEVEINKYQLNPAEFNNTHLYFPEQTKEPDIKGTTIVPICESYFKKQSR